METEILVPFEGEGSGTFDLTWGQLEIWIAMCDQNSSLPMGGAMALPAGGTVEHAKMTLRHIMSRQQSLRTRLLFDESADGGVRQVLHSRGEAPLLIVDTEEGEDPQQVATGIFERFSGKKFDYAAEWPVRMALVRQNGVATHSVVVYCHLALDAHGLQVVMADLAGLDYTTGTHPLPGKAMQPIDLARSEREPEGRRHHEATVKRWRRQLAKVPSQRFGESGDERTPRYWRGFYDSRASYLATQLICERTRAESTAVVLAAVAVELARVSGRGPSVLQTVVHNRFRPGLADMVSPIAQTGLSVIDVADCSFDEVVAKAWRSSIQAYMNSYYNPVLLDEEVARIGRERGEEFDLNCYFNDLRAEQSRLMEGPLATGEQVTAALERSSFFWGEASVDPTARFFLTVENVQDTLMLRMDTDTRGLGPGDIERLLYGTEQLLVKAAFDPAVSTGIHAPVRAEQESAVSVVSVG